MRKWISCGTIIFHLALGVAGCALDAEEDTLGESAVPFGPDGSSPVNEVRALAGGTGVPSVWGPADKSFLGTSTTAASRVYFTGYRGIVSEVFYPVLDTVNTVDLQFMVGDTAKTFVDEEKSQSYTVTQPDKRSMRWQATTTNSGHNWRITKTIFTDPARNTLIQRVQFDALGGKNVTQFNLYLLHNPAMDNSGAGDTSKTVTVTGTVTRTMLVASENSRASALAISRPWKTLTTGGPPMVSSGFVGETDGWTDLLGGTSDKTMSWRNDLAGGGNVAQMGWVDLGTSAVTSLSFDVVLGFGATETEATTTTNATLNDPAGLSSLRNTYDSGWNSYTSTLNSQGGTADDQYYLAAMALKSVEDKSNGAMIAGMGTPWGETSGDSNNGGYHLVWPRDLFKFANALVTAGDTSTPPRVVNYLFNTLQQTSDCGAGEYNAPGCPQGYSRVGRFPQNAWVSGWQYWQGTQMDEQAMPIILAWRLGPAVYNPLWPKIKKTADYIVNVGPWTQQERWEENSGYSPSTIAAEIAGLVCAATIARANGDTTSAARYLAAADYWQQSIDRWTFTTTGFHGDGRYYIRINPSLRGNSGAGPQVYNPVAGPDAAINITHGNGGGTHDQRYIIDGGFLELVRMGVKRANDPSIVDTIEEYDATLRQTITGKGQAWFRYNYDGYGERNDGANYDGLNGRGRLWPIFTAERGMFEIAALGTGTAGSPFLTAVKAFSTPQGFIPEQVWNNTATITGWQVTKPASATAGTPTRSMSPLNWAMGEYISLLASIRAGKIVDIPSVVCGRYNTCVVPPASNEAVVSVNVTATTVVGQQVYVTGNTAALGNWNTDLGIPVDPATYPVWKNRVNLPASSALQYKYYRKNADGSVTWENRPGGGNRSLSTPAAGATLTLNDTVTW
ncbi:glycoside hydrolase family 15 protein [Sorangium sp. So ce1389]|uniref:glycoside hydrolase family 15 protein n=1 Tax=Sorangium sp. So ce1389 TaxID=3133336 RepID=UPI003F622EA7